MIFLVLKFLFKVSSTSKNAPAIRKLKNGIENVIINGFKFNGNGPRNLLEFTHHVERNVKYFFEKEQVPLSLEEIRKLAQALQLGPVCFLIFFLFLFFFYMINSFIRVIGLNVLMDIIMQSIFRAIKKKWPKFENMMS